MPGDQCNKDPEARTALHQGPFEGAPRSAGRELCGKNHDVLFKIADFVRNRDILSKITILPNNRDPSSGGRS